MTNKEIQELKERIYNISYSGFPLDSFFNDIEKNDNPRFNKDLAYKDLKLIVDEIYKLKDKAKKYDEINRVYLKNEVMESADINAERLQQLYEDMQTFIDKATPKKTIKEPIIKDRYRQYKNYCPICKQELPILGDYCSYCGQAVDWSDEDDK